jgi:(E)-4-hydroxy-3-methylbut-2-enyl-diphosphate synthase
VESALGHAALLEKYGYDDLVLSIKSSNVRMTVDACRLCAQQTGYPQHIGVTGSGTRTAGSVKSAIGIGTLLCDGIGDTVRVSLTDDPIKEIAAARRILDALQIEGQSGMDIVSCPTCGRTQIDLISLSEQFKEAVRAEGLDRLPIKVALMGCVVNGPGEAREADIGIAGGRGEGLLFRHGEIVEKLPESELIPRLLAEIRAMRDQM